MIRARSSMMFMCVFSLCMWQATQAAGRADLFHRVEQSVRSIPKKIVAGAIALLVLSPVFSQPEGFYNQISQKIGTYAPSMPGYTVTWDPFLYPNVIERFTLADRFNEEDYMVLHKAAREGQREVVELCIEKGAPINFVDAYGMTPLHWAVRNGYKEIVAFLIEQGADIHVQAPDGSTLLHSVAGGLSTKSDTAEDDRYAIAALLIKQGVKLNAITTNSLTALHVAAGIGRHGIVALLLCKGADVEAVDNDQWTPLHIAAARGKREVIKVLLHNGADREHKDARGKTPLEVAQPQVRDVFKRIFAIERNRCS
jgi:ankyrin repeat protein